MANFHQYEPKITTFGARNREISVTEYLPFTNGISDDKIIPIPPPTPFAQFRLPAELRKRFALSSEASIFLFCCHLIYCLICWCVPWDMWDVSSSFSLFLFILLCPDFIERINSRHFRILLVQLSSAEPRVKWARAKRVKWPHEPRWLVFHSQDETERIFVAWTTPKV